MYIIIHRDPLNGMLIVIFITILFPFIIDSTKFNQLAIRQSINQPIKINQSADINIT